MAKRTASASTVSAVKTRDIQPLVDDAKAMAGSVPPKRLAVQRPRHRIRAGLWR
jgi:hypothetical protein